jgi:hypothetical protein
MKPTLQVFLAAGVPSKTGSSIGVPEQACTQSLGCLAAESTPPGTSDTKLKQRREVASPSLTSMQSGLDARRISSETQTKQRFSRVGQIAEIISKHIGIN